MALATRWEQMTEPTARDEWETARPSRLSASLRAVVFVLRLQYGSKPLRLLVVEAVTLADESPAGWRDE
jgi:hypothetical protein